MTAKVYEPDFNGSGQPPRPPREEPPTLWADQMAEPLPPVAWVSKTLSLAPGRPSVIAGQGGVGKGWLAMASLLCGAYGLPLLGRIGFRLGLRGIYADYEQSERATRERFQLLAGGYQVSLAGLGKRLGYRWKPVPTWAPVEAKRQWTLDQLYWQTEEVDVMFVDSLRASAPGVEENSSQASLPLDVATDVSVKTGCTIVFLDHASGKAQDGQKRVDAQRGHSSKKDACQTLLVLSSSKGKPTLVTCERAQISAQDDWAGDFAYRLRQAAGGVVLQEEPIEDGSAAILELRLQVLSYIEANPGCFTKEVAEELGGRKATIVAMIGSLLSEKVITRQDGRLYVPSPDGEIP